MKKKLESFSSFQFDLKKNQAKSIIGGYGGGITGESSYIFYWTNPATQPTMDSEYYDTCFD